MQTSSNSRRLYRAGFVSLRYLVIFFFFLLLFSPSLSLTLFFLLHLIRSFRRSSTSGWLSRHPASFIFFSQFLPLSRRVIQFDLFNLFARRLDSEIFLLLPQLGLALLSRNNIPEREREREREEYSSGFVSLPFCFSLSLSLVFLSLFFFLSREHCHGWQYFTITRVYGPP